MTKYNVTDRYIGSGISELYKSKAQTDLSSASANSRLGETGKLNRKEHSIVIRPTVARVNPELRLPLR